jgi:hypothetical protein
MTSNTKNKLLEGGNGSYLVYQIWYESRKKQ